MPSIKDLWPDKWLRAADLGNARPIVTIQTVTVEDLFDPRAKQMRPKLIIAFFKKQKRLPLNKTQAQALADITGTDDYSLWHGHQVVVSAGIAPNKAATIVISPVPDKTGDNHAA